MPDPDGRGQCRKLPETSVLVRLDRGGPVTSSALAKLEQISPQSMVATLGAPMRTGSEQAGSPLPTRRRS